MGGHDWIAAIVVPKRQHAELSAEELLVVLGERLTAGSIELASCENVRGLVVVQLPEFAEWQHSGLLTPLGKLVRGAIAKRYASQLDAIYAPEFQFEADCRTRMNSKDVRGQLVGMIAFMLKVDPTMVEQHNGHFGSLGLNSLGAAQLASTLKQENFNRREVSSAVLMNMDLDGVVECVYTGKVTLHAQSELLSGMKADSKISDDLRQTIAAQHAKDTLCGVFVTGGTGALGSAIIADILCNAPSVGNILCLVRANGVDQGRRRLLPPICAAMGVAHLPADVERRVFPVCGLLEDDRLGLEEDECVKLAKHVDCIIHCAAVVNHVLPYTSHSEVNVSGTQRLLELAVAGGSNAAVHFVSTAAVVLASRPENPILEAAPLSMPPSVSNLNGYAQSKLVSELVCWDAAAAGLQVAIYRPGIISSHHTSGYCKPEDFYPLLLQAISSHGIYPTVRPDATFDMTPLDWVSRGIAHIALKATAADMAGSGVTVAERVFHTIAKGSHEVLFQTLVDGVCACGRDPQEVDFFTFLQGMMSVNKFVPLLHELRSAGRCSVRWLDTAAFDRAVADAIPPMPPSHVTADVVARCLAFCTNNKAKL